MIDIEKYTQPKYIPTVSFALENDFQFFCRFFFQVLEGSEFALSDHHKLLIKTLTDVQQGHHKRLIINLPPGYSKTVITSIMYPAWAIARNPKNRFMHLSYSDTLALKNSSATKRIIESPEYQTFWPLSLRTDTKGKKIWQTEQGSEYYCASSYGQITGNRAGYMDKSYVSGAILIDDILKPADAYSVIQRMKVNGNYNETIKSRLAHEDVPVVLIMQRLHVDDTTGFLIEGGSGDRWDVLSIPVLIEENDQLPPDTEYARYIPHGLPAGPLWPMKHDYAEIEILKKTSNVYASQYQQSPKIPGGNMLKQAWFNFYNSWEGDSNLISVGENSFNLTKKILTADTALTANTTSDFSVFMVGGKDASGNIYILDVLRGKWEAPDLKSRYLAFCAKHTGKVSKLSNRYCEMKASGFGLVQDINRTNPQHRLEGVQRNVDKVSRVNGISPVIETGQVYLPKNAPWLDEFLDEVTSFSETMSHKHDDQVDALCDMVDKLVTGKNWDWLKK